MSLMPRGSDDIAGLLGVGALVGALSGARAPKRGSRPGLLSTLLARSIEEERAAQEARIRQEQAQMAFLGSIAPKMLEMGIPMGNIFNDDVYARLGMNPDEMNKAITTVAVKGMLPALQQYAPHATQDQLAGLASGDYHRAADFFVSDANRDVHRNAALFPALVQQLGSANGLLALSGMTPDGRAMSGDGSMFSNTGGYLSVLGEGLKGAQDAEFRRADTLDANSMGRRRALQDRKYAQDVALVDRENSWKLIQTGMPLGVDGLDLSDPKGSIEKVSKAVREGRVSATQGAKDVERMKVVDAFNEDLKKTVLPWFAAPKGKDGGEDPIEAERRKRTGIVDSGPDYANLKKSVGALIEMHYPRLASVGYPEEDILRFTSQIGIPAYGPQTVKGVVDRRFEEKIKIAGKDTPNAKDMISDPKIREGIYNDTVVEVLEELGKSGIVYGVNGFRY